MIDKGKGHLNLTGFRGAFLVVSGHNYDVAGESFTRLSHDCSRQSLYQGRGLRIID